MSVYVDELQDYPVHMIERSARRHGRRWCHLTADFEDELKAFAAKIGLKPPWFQPDRIHPHFDITPFYRNRALLNGAVFKPAKEQARERIQKIERLREEQERG